jgi:hypothetical protein
MATTTTTTTTTTTPTTTTPTTTTTTTTQGYRKDEGRQIQSIGEPASVIRTALQDERLQDAFIEAIHKDPELVSALAKITPKTWNVAAGWSCCRSDRPQLVDLPEETGGNP